MYSSIFQKNLFLCHYFSENGVKIIIFAYLQIIPIKNKEEIWQQQLN